MDDAAPTPPDVERLQKIDHTIKRQRDFLGQVPDPDTRDRAEANLVMLMQMRDALEGASRSRDMLSRFDSMKAAL